MNIERTETLVVGGGPAGLFLAAELRRHGRDCVLIESAAEPSAYSKALAVMPRTMELFEAAGLARAFAGAANRIDGVRFVSPRGSALIAFERLESVYNYVSILPQWKTQQLLAARLRELGGDVRHGHKLTGLRQTGAGVEATIETREGVRTLRARYAVGCDGMHSTVRAQAGIAFPGETYPGSALLADTHVKTQVPVNEARVHVHRTGAVTMFPMSADLRRVVVIAPGETLPECADRQWLQKRLDEAGYGDSEIGQPVWTNGFRVHRRIATAMRSGNVFLAGDSVHAHSPVGGQGMNIGLHDAWNLAEKLARVLEGSAPESLLDAYERERLPVARAALRRTDVLTRALAHPNPAVRIAREAAPALLRFPAVYSPMLRALSQLDQA